MKTPHPNAQGIAVIIPTHNSEQTLRSCLRSVHAQTLPCKQILVIDNHSTDSTRQIAEASGAKVILHRGPQAAARNIGLLNSTAPFILFLDSDQQLKPDAAEACIKACVASGAQAAKIPEVFVGETFWGQCSAFYKNKMVKAWGQTGGLPRFFTREVLTNLSAFKGELRYWEDQELHQRLHASGVKETWSKTRIYHREKGSLHDVTRKYLSYGRSVKAFTETDTEAPYAATAKLTLLTLFSILRNPGRSTRLMFGFSFLFTVKSMCAILGFLTAPSFYSSPHRNK